MPPKLQFNAAPLTNVILLNGFTERSNNHGTSVRFENLPSLIDTINRAVTLKPNRLDANEIQYLRHWMDISQAELGKIIGVESQTVSLWERGNLAISTAGDIILRKACIETNPRIFSGQKGKISIKNLSILARSPGQITFECHFHEGKWEVSATPCTHHYRHDIAEIVHQIDHADEKYIVIATSGSAIAFGEVRNAIEDSCNQGYQRRTSSSYPVPRNEIPQYNYLLN